MARLLGVGLQGLRCSRLLSSPLPLSLREAQVFTLPDSNRKARRWFAENAALEEFDNSMQTANDSLGVGKAVNEGESSSKHPHESRNNLISGKGSGANEVATAPEGTAEKSSSERDTEKLTDFILSYKSTGNKQNASKGFANKNHTGPILSKPRTPEAESNTATIGKNQWERVMKSIREMSAKTKPIVGHSSSDQRSQGKIESGNGNEDDFADLDIPRQGDKAGVSGSSNGPSKPSLLADAFERQPALNSRHRDGYQQYWNQQKAKEMRPANFDSPSQPNNVPVRGEMPGKSFPKREETGPNTFKDSRPFPNAESGYRVCISNLPATSNVALVKDALSLYGEITGSFKKFTSNDSCTCYIEFKTEEGMEDALAARWLQLESKSFPIHRVNQPVTTVIRVTKVSSETSESQILFTCGRCGSIDNIKRRGNGIFDVYYKVRELPNIPKILSSLNEVTLHCSKWIALPAPLLHPSEMRDLLKSRGGQVWHLSQMNRMLNKMEAGLQNVAVCFEDLKVLSSMEEELGRSLRR